MIARLITAALALLAPVSLGGQSVSRPPETMAYHAAMEAADRLDDIHRQLNGLPSSEDDIGDADDLTAAILMARMALYFAGMACAGRGSMEHDTSRYLVMFQIHQLVPAFADLRYRGDEESLDALLAMIEEVSDQMRRDAETVYNECATSGR